MEWIMLVSIGHAWNEHAGVKLVPIITKTKKHSEALSKALTWLKRSASKSPSLRRYPTITLTPYRETKNRDYELYRARAWFRTPHRIKSIKDPMELFVQGYGPKALDEIFEKFREEFRARDSH